MLENRVIEKLVEFGGNHWTKVASKSKKAIDRVYFGAKALGLTSESELISWEETEWSGVNLIVKALENSNPSTAKAVPLPLSGTASLP